MMLQSKMHSVNQAYIGTEMIELWRRDTHEIRKIVCNLLRWETL